MPSSVQVLTRIKQAMAAGLLGCFSMLSQAVEIKDDAPQSYTVKKNDTLWDIASMFLSEPWEWPELWRNNTQIANPHLIYPGDVLSIRMVDGEPQIVVQRDKRFLTVTPQAVKEQKPSPISMLPWDAIATYVSENELLEPDRFEVLPHLLGNQTGDIRFVNDDYVLSRRYGRADDQYRVIRKQSTIRDMEGEVLGVQVLHVADAKMVEERAQSQWLVKIDKSNYEALRGDKLYAGKFTGAEDMQLQPAKEQRGYVVGNLHNHGLLGKHDVVVVDIGKAAIAAGTVLGIYAQGPDIIDGETPRYADESNVVRSVFRDGSTVIQPALKIGELVIFKTFDKASYGIITRARELVKHGAIVAKP